MEEQQAEQDNRFLKRRQIANMIYDNFKISETGEALLDNIDLLRVQLDNDNVQGFDTKWDGDILEKWYKKQPHFSEDLKPLMASTPRIQFHKGKVASYSRLKEMVCRHVEQKMRDNNLNARNEDRSLHGAAAWTGHPKGNSKGNAQETIKDQKHGYCDQWIPKGQCSFKHDVNKKGTGKRRRSRSQSETRRHSKGDEKRRYQRERSQRFQSVRRGRTIVHF